MINRFMCRNCGEVILETQIVVSVCGKVGNKTYTVKRCPFCYGLDFRTVQPHLNISKVAEHIVSPPENNKQSGCLLKNKCKQFVKSIDK